jgi:hypothetical protein
MLNEDARMVLYLNIYERPKRGNMLTAGSYHPDRKSADEAAESSASKRRRDLRIACVRVGFTRGQFDK